MKIKKYDNLPEEAKQIRTHVFVEEQGFTLEFDEIDNIAKHLVCFEGTMPIATCRFYQEEKGGDYLVGRIAVEKSSRGKNIGGVILKEAEKQIQKTGGKTVKLSAQQQAAGFYEKQGYVSVGEPYMDEDCPHIMMYKSLE